MLLLSFLVLVFFSWKSVKTDGVVNMLLFWGYPTFTSESQWCVMNKTVGNFEACMNSCLDNEMCMLSFGNDTNCRLCFMYAITEITQTDSTGGIMIAVKVDGQDSCPVNIQDHQYSFTNGNNTYTMTYSDPSWTITTPKTCADSDWKMFARPMGPFCIKVIWNGNKGISRNDAVGICNQTPDGWLSGFNSVGEYNYIYTTAKSFFPALLNYDYLTVWISGLMKTSCASTPVPTTGCSGLDAFQEFPHQTNFDLYKFPPQYPNMTSLPAGSGGYYQRCLQLTWSQQLTAYNGMVTNSACEYACNGAQQICAFSYACGALAT